VAVEVIGAAIRYVQILTATVEAGIHCTRVEIFAALRISALVTPGSHDFDVEYAEVVKVYESIKIQVCRGAPRDAYETELALKQGEIYQIYCAAVVKVR